MTKQSCKTCRFLVVPLNQAQKRVVRSQNSYQCGCTTFELKAPDSITQSVGWSVPRPSWMQGSEGTTCPTYEALP
jgi:hypothetical protein